MKLKDRQVPPTPRMTALCTHYVPAAVKERLLKILSEAKIRHLGEAHVGRSPLARLLVLLSLFFAL